MALPAVAALLVIGSVSIGVVFAIGESHCLHTAVRAVSSSELIDSRGAHGVDQLCISEADTRGVRFDQWDEYSGHVGTYGGKKQEKKNGPPPASS